MTRFGFGAQGMVLLGTSSSEDDKSLAGSEELAMPLFDSQSDRLSVTSAEIAGLLRRFKT